MKMKRTWFSGLIGKIIAILLVINTLASLQVYAAVTPVQSKKNLEGYGFHILIGVRCRQMLKHLRNVQTKLWQI